MFMKFINYFKINIKLLIFNIIFFILLFLLGYYVQDSFNNNELSIFIEKHSFYTIFFHNISIAIFMVIGTFIFGYLIFIMNCLFLGMNIYGAFVINSASEVLLTMVFYGVLEILAWFLTLQLSVTFTRSILKKSEKINITTLFLVIGLYLLAAIAEAITISLR